MRTKPPSTHLPHSSNRAYDRIANPLFLTCAHKQVIDNAFQQFTTLAQAITSNTTVPATRQQAINNMYTLLTTDPNYGPNAVLTAVTNYQRYTLGFGGSQGLLAFVPMMVCRVAAHATSCEPSGACFSIACLA